MGSRCRGLLGQQNTLFELPGNQIAPHFLTGLNFDIMHTPSPVTRDQGQGHAQTTPAMAAGLLQGR
jgi:hypothetical protein